MYFSVVDSPGPKVDQTVRLEIFQAQVANVRSLKSAIRQIRRAVNEALRRNDVPATDAFTKAYALLFCAWAEANFSKVVHTPHGFELDEIAQIQAAKSNGIRNAWKKCVELGLRHLDAKRGSFKPNARQKLEEAIDRHVFDPTLLRNKLAHGQWVSALNRDNTALQPDLTTEIQILDVVKISGWETGHELLARLIENLIESPKKAFMRDWYGYVVDLEEHILDAENRTLAEHVARLKAKETRTGAKHKKADASRP